MMKYSAGLLLFGILGLLACSPFRNTGGGGRDRRFLLDTLRLVDASRNRIVPVAIWKPAGCGRTPDNGMIVLSHGYGQNRPDSYLSYTYLTCFLAERGYLVVSVQHELPADSLIPQTGIPAIVRRPFWERGADNIFFVIKEMKNRFPDRSFEHICLIGHSNGGDMTALFPQKYPGIVDKIITLDNRRMPLPRTAHPKVYTLRSSDQTADEGVLPSADDCRRFGISIVHLNATPHNNMDDSGNSRQKKAIKRAVFSFLNN